MRVVVVALAAAAFASCAPAATRPPDALDVVRPPADPAAAALARGHSHNDYERERPLDDALAARLYSVEADVWLTGGYVMVSHRPWDFVGKLSSLYLDKLAARVERWGSVYGDGLGFTLWVDIKPSDPALTEALFELFEGYPMLTRFSPAGVEQGAVTVVLTGDEVEKRAFVERHPTRRATRDEHAISADDPPADGAWGYYALDWDEAVGWDGDGELPEGARAALESLVDIARDKERPLRFWDLPDHEGGWAAAYDAGVDFINTDRPRDLAAFLRSR